MNPEGRRVKTVLVLSTVLNSFLPFPFAASISLEFSLISNQKQKNVGLFVTIKFRLLGNIDENEYADNSGSDEPYQIVVTCLFAIDIRNI